VVYCASREASVYALDVQTGAVKWKYLYGLIMWVESSPVLVDDLLYVSSSGNQTVYA
jgi:outer membrane protein assembly factor BamB